MRHPRNTTRRVTGLACAAAIAVTAGISTTALAHADSRPHDAPAPAAPPTDGTAERIEFAPGTDNATVSGGVARGERHRYVLWAAEGQYLWAEVSSLEQNAVITIYSPDGTVLPGGETGYFAGGTLPKSGDYVIDVSTLRGNAEYAVFVRVTDGEPGDEPAGEPGDEPTGTTERIRFAPGTNNASVEGAIVRGTTDRYLLWAAAGQTMVAHVDSVTDNVYLSVYAPDGTPLAENLEQATVELPINGDYLVAISTTSSGGPYQLSVWIE